MQLICFSKNKDVLDYLLEKSRLVDDRFEVIMCDSFAVLGDAIENEDHLLVYFLTEGDEAEKICYQFISKYQQQHKMLVLVKKPDARQGLRLFRAGVHGYSNLRLDDKKFKVALDVLEQGKIWIAAETLKTLINDCQLRRQQEQQAQPESTGHSINEASASGSDNKKGKSLVSRVVGTIKGWFR